MSERERERERGKGRSSLFVCCFFVVWRNDCLCLFRSWAISFFLSDRFPHRVHHRIAESFQKGRCFLVGDAAHLHSPAGGQGMNTGLQVFFHFHSLIRYFSLFYTHTHAHLLTRSHTKTHRQTRVSVHRTPKTLHGNWHSSFSTTPLHSLSSPLTTSRDTLLAKN